MTRTREENASDLMHEQIAKKRFYVTMTWDDWPEGGSFGTIVEAKNHEEAEELCRREMAACRGEGGCAHCGEDTWHALQYHDHCQDCLERMADGEELENTDAGIERALDEYGDEWHVVDCFDLDEFIADNQR